MGRYVEGLEVLYRTNTIHIANATLFPRLQRLLVPERLADIVSLELVWGHHELRPSLWGPSRPAQLPLYLHILSDHLTGLRKVFISVVKPIYPNHADITKDVFEPLDGFVGSTPRLTEVCVSVPWLTFSKVVVAAVKPTPRAVRNAASEEKFAPLHIWRPLSGDYVAVEVAESPYPDSPVGAPQRRSTGSLTGYWIVEGHEPDSTRDLLIYDPA